MGKSEEHQQLRIYGAYNVRVKLNEVVDKKAFLEVTKYMMDRVPLLSPNVRESANRTGVSRGSV